MHRRRFLALTGAGLAAAAGCLGGPGAGTNGSPTESPGDGEGPSPSPTDTPESVETTLDLGEPYVSPAGWSVTPSNARVRKIALRADPHLDPIAYEGGQYVVVDVAVEGDANGAGTPGVLPAPDEFAVALHGTTSAPEQPRSWHGYPGTPAENRGTMAVPVATAAADAASVSWRTADPSVEWRLTAAHMDAIATAPAFEVREFALPDAVEHGAEFDASLTVANVGDRDGEFLAEVGATTISDTPELSFAVPAGGAVDHVEPLSPHYPTDADELRVVLNWGIDRLERTVAIE